MPLCVGTSCGSDTPDGGSRASPRARILSTKSKSSRLPKRASGAPDGFWTSAAVRARSPGESVASGVTSWGLTRRSPRSSPPAAAAARLGSYGRQPRRVSRSPKPRSTPWSSVWRSSTSTRSSRPSTRSPGCSSLADASSSFWSTHFFRPPGAGGSSTSSGGTVLADRQLPRRPRGDRRGGPRRPVLLRPSAAQSLRPRHGRGRALDRGHGGAIPPGSRRRGDLRLSEGRQHPATALAASPSDHPRR